MDREFWDLESVGDITMDDLTQMNIYETAHRQRILIIEYSCEICMSA